MLAEVEETGLTTGEHKEKEVVTKDEKNGQATATTTGAVGGEEPMDNKLRKQIEFYFGDNNFPRDKFMKTECAKDEGWLPIETLLKFNRLLAILDGVKVEDRTTKIAEALRSSSLVDVHESGLKLKRNPEVPFPEGNSNTRTVYLKGIGKEVKLDALLEHYKKFEGVDAIVMRYYKEKTIVDEPKKEEEKNGNGTAEGEEKDKETPAKKLEIAQPTKVVWQRKFKGSIFVVFNTEENAKKLIDEENTSYCDVPLLKMLQKEYMEKKEADYKARIEARKERKEGGGGGGGGSSGNVEKKEKDGSESIEETETVDDVPQGVFFKMTNIPENITYGMIKEKWHGALDKEKFQISYVDFEKGEKEGILRLTIENSAPQALEALTDKKFSINDTEFINVELLSPEVEAAHRAKVIQDRLQRKRQSHHNSRGGGGRGRGGGGRGRGRGGGGRGGKRRKY